MKKLLFILIAFQLVIGCGGVENFLPEQDLKIVRTKQDFGDDTFETNISKFDSKKSIVSFRLFRERGQVF